MGALEAPLLAYVDPDGLTAEEYRSQQAIAIAGHHAKCVVGSLQSLVQVFGVELVLLGGDGSMRPFEEICTTLADGSGELLRLQGG